MCAAILQLVDDGSWRRSPTELAEAMQKHVSDAERRTIPIAIQRTGLISGKFKGAGMELSIMGRIQPINEKWWIKLDTIDRQHPYLIAVDEKNPAVIFIIEPVDQK